MANSFHSGIPAKVQTMINGITAAIGNSLALDFSESPGLVLTIKLTPDGNVLNVMARSEDQGPNLKPAFKVNVALLP